VLEKISRMLSSRVTPRVTAKMIESRVNRVARTRAFRIFGSLICRNVFKKLEIINRKTI
jgi:hypothetical protein